MPNSSVACNTGSERGYARGRSLSNRRAARTRHSQSEPTLMIHPTADLDLSASRPLALFPGYPSSGRNRQGDRRRHISGLRQSHPSGQYGAISDSQPDIDLRRKETYYSPPMATPAQPVAQTATGFLARWSRPLAVAAAIVFFVSLAFPMIAGLSKNTASFPLWWGRLDVGLAFVLAIMAFSIGF